MQETIGRASSIKSSQCVQRIAILLVLGLFCAAPASAGEKKQKEFPSIGIKNFGKVDDRLYRGAQPDEEDFRALAALGIKTVINLREEGKDFEAQAVSAAGMRYIHMPMSDSKLPPDERAAEFLKIVNDPANGPVFVHCAGGRHRTGVMVAVYRLNFYGWDIERAYQEMKEYDFYTRWGHGAMKDYVFSYYKNMHRSNTPANNTTIKTEQPDTQAK
ncbi:MAG: tyrosine-protein phosphatase [Acidobacteriota bacterium]